MIGVGVVFLVGNLRTVETTTSSNSYTDVTGVRLDLDNADVRVASGGPQVEVDVTIRRGRVDVQPSATVDDGILVLGLDCPVVRGWLFGNRCAGDYVIALPPGTTISGATGNGRVEVDGIDGQIDLTTDNGAVELSAITGPARVTSSNGRIEGADLRSATVVATTDNGGVDLAFATTPTSVTAESSNGGIAITVPADNAAWRVDAGTDNGAVTIDVPVDDGAGRSLDLDTSNGSITVSTP